MITPHSARHSRDLAVRVVLGDREDYEKAAPRGGSLKLTHYPLLGFGTTLVQGERTGESSRSAQDACTTQSPSRSSPDAVFPEAR